MGIAAKCKVAELLDVPIHSIKSDKHLHIEFERRIRRSFREKNATLKRCRGRVRTEGRTKSAIHKLHFSLSIQLIALSGR